MNVSALPRFELASSIALTSGTGGWWVLGANDPSTQATLLASELESMLAQPVEVVPIEDASKLVTESDRTSARTVVMVASADVVRALELDAWRSRLVRAQPAVLVFPSQSLPELMTRAPHFLSWIGAQVCGVEEDRFLAAAAAQERLTTLRERYRVSDDEMIARAERGEAPPDAEVAEWLVLLGRQDLVGSR